MLPIRPDRQDGQSRREDAREIQIRIDVSRGRGCSGCLWFCLLDRTLFFPDLGTMLMQMDEVMDEAGLPQRTFEPRTGESFFEYKSLAPEIDREEIKREILSATNGYEPYIPIGSKACRFAVHVYRRDQCSIQGTIQWFRGTTRKAVFRSGMELLRLIQDAVAYQREELRAAQERI